MTKTIENDKLRRDWKCKQVKQKMKMQMNVKDG